ncbi:nucleotide-diphospho-sugar transferase-domain-containing protein [Gongronella butleri]|nr:nucleotide-diphospho-sugar transferase-domain-containing protein [Gongronella butleri]
MHPTLSSNKDVASSYDDAYTSGSTTTTLTDADAAVSDDENAIASDEPEEENLVQVSTKPTAEDDFVPKQFDAPSAEMTALIKKNLLKYRKDQILLTAVVNSGMADYTLNWIESLKRTKLDKKYMVFAIDDELVDIMKQHGYEDHVVRIPDDWFHAKLSSDFSVWEGKGYAPITHAKSLVVERLLYMDITVWFSDVDIVFTNAAVYDYLVMKLNSPRKKHTEMLFSQETEEEILNSGFYLMRPTLTAKRVLADSIKIADTENVTQQRAINRIIDDLDLNYQRSKVATLDLALFPHGRMYFERHVPTKFNMEPMIVHANYRVGGEKKKSLEKAGLWYI